ncbi:MAG TPA: hypothetical protein DIT64_13285, partial [Verrucomicrobiales bacterium]|nr:hypothetical protein [Verrucomicrobiales bacterium]
MTAAEACPKPQNINPTNHVAMIRTLQLCRTLACGVLAATLLLSGQIQAQETQPATAATPTLEELAADLADVQAYINNGARVTEAGKSKIAGPGPGHNAWQMVSTALVLFMTLP